MKKLLVLLLLPLVAPLAWSQSTIYRCGNEYTNNANRAKELGCKAVDGGHVTVIHGGPRPAAAAASPAVAARSPAPAPRADSSAQRARDSDARAILNGELARSQERMAQLELEYNNGYPERTALELRNPQAHIDRTASLKAQIARYQSDIAGLRREIARLPGAAPEAPAGAPAVVPVN
ncbi:hypothetical protein [Comamonas endophytica]|uniref:DUF4124 domain-containing protein n=1 Tax=Comamonas endophytica TaxID=2949090 RepID=A0ABY6GC41_9BURK|nr:MULTISPECIES: hypothetical protein [unclassified Acidovorax]MCD2513719.1 hypothetical protein [Acidovorax sp. D4N7]UYG52275.1 hypothetical protein M9799_03275 [Acidovorax sp. 5MLIR]